MYPHLDQTDHGRSLSANTEVQEVVRYLRSRGLAAKEDHGRVLELLLQMPARCGYGRVSVTRAAMLLYTSRRSLARLCKRAGMPVPGRILGFGRVLNTLQLLRATGWPATKAADATGWPDPFSFSTAVHRLTGLRPSMARTKGLLAFAEAWLQKELAEGTISLRQPDPPPCPSCGRVVDPTASRSFSSSIT